MKCLCPTKILMDYVPSAKRRSRTGQKAWNNILFEQVSKKSGNISIDEYQKIGETVWYCRKCIAMREKNKSVQQANIFSVTFRI